MVSFYYRLVVRGDRVTVKNFREKIETNVIRNSEGEIFGLNADHCLISKATFDFEIKSDSETHVTYLFASYEAIYIGELASEFPNLAMVFHEEPDQVQYRRWSRYEGGRLVAEFYHDHPLYLNAEGELIEDPFLLKPMGGHPIPAVRSEAQ